MDGQLLDREIDVCLVDIQKNKSISPLILSRLQCIVLYKCQLTIDFTNKTIGN
jgi:hypothetical protein